MKARILIVGLLTASATIFGQTVTQGDPNVVANANEFHSPMVIETIFAGNDPSLWMDPESLAPGKTPKHMGAGKWFSTVEWYDLGKYTCDGVSLRRNVSKGRFPPGTSSRKGVWEESGLKMRVRPLSAEQVEVRIEPSAYNPKPSHDKLVTFTVDVLNA